MSECSYCMGTGYVLVPNKYGEAEMSNDMCSHCGGTGKNEKEQPPTDMDIWNDLQRQNDQLKAENERLREALREIAKDSSYREDFDNEVGWHIDNAYEVMNKLKEKAQQALNEVTK